MVYVLTDERRKKKSIVEVFFKNHLKQLDARNLLYIRVKRQIEAFRTLISIWHYFQDVWRIRTRLVKGERINL